MNTPETHEKIRQVMNEFEFMDDLHPSAGWQDSLMDRLNLTRPVESDRIHKVIYTTAFLLLLLANAGSFITMISTRDTQDDGREKSLKTISREFLINPTSWGN